MEGAERVVDGVGSLNQRRGDDEQRETAIPQHLDHRQPHPRRPLGSQIRDLGAGHDGDGHRTQRHPVDHSRRLADQSPPAADPRGDERERSPKPHSAVIDSPVTGSEHG